MNSKGLFSSIVVTSGIKAFGSKYNRKGNKRLLRKNRRYRLKHF